MKTLNTQEIHMVSGAGIADALKGINSALTNINAKLESTNNAIENATHPGQQIGLTHKAIGLGIASSILTAISERLAAKAV
ncbi:hypothetical protein ACFSFZ_13545 [Mixta tenebrionis]|uniref:Uncharacterized protein n=1 Tax=Mixta tenebrionis TaxID=2562439 RepID=A0A506VFG1_9GAMM|nr:hypothetical protein [Mixta tenebrionis]TPW44375.1 hypothetical protein FKM52_01295 [Mixta tenebrionis]